MFDFFDENDDGNLIDVDSDDSSGFDIASDMVSGPLGCDSLEDFMDWERDAYIYGFLDPEEEENKREYGWDDDDDDDDDDDCIWENDSFLNDDEDDIWGDHDLSKNNRDKGIWTNDFFLKDDDEGPSYSTSLNYDEWLSSLEDEDSTVEDSDNETWAEELDVAEILDDDEIDSMDMAASGAFIGNVLNRDRKQPTAPVEEKEDTEISENKDEDNLVIPLKLNISTHIDEDKFDELLRNVILSEPIQNIIGYRNLVQQAVNQPEDKKTLDISREYAVMMIFVYDEDGKPGILLERRASGLDTQPGEICFPGGKVEEGEIPIIAAYRETFEELGLEPSLIHVQGEISKLHSYSNFTLTAIAAEMEIENLSKIEMNTDEVSEWFVIELEEFIKTEPYMHSMKILPQTEDFPYEMVDIDRDYPWRTGYYNVPIYKVAGRTVWGLTANLIHNFVQRIKEMGALGEDISKL